MHTWQEEEKSFESSLNKPSSDEQSATAWIIEKRTTNQIPAHAAVASAHDTVRP